MFGFSSKATKAQIALNKANAARGPISQEEFSKGLRIDTAGMTTEEAREEYGF